MKKFVNKKVLLSILTNISNYDSSEVELFSIGAGHIWDIWPQGYLPWGTYLTNTGNRHLNLQPRGLEYSILFLTTAPSEPQLFRK